VRIPEGRGAGGGGAHGGRWAPRSPHLTSPVRRSPAERGRNEEFVAPFLVRRGRTLRLPEEEKYWIDKPTLELSLTIHIQESFSSDSTRKFSPLIFPRCSAKERTISTLAVGGRPQKQGSLQAPLSRSRSRIKDFASPAERVGVEVWAGAVVASRLVGVGVGGVSVVAVGVGEGGGVAVGFFRVPVEAGTVIFRTGTGVPVGLSGACACVGLTMVKQGIKFLVRESV
jgi:hypothetical protein